MPGVGAGSDLLGLLDDVHHHIQGGVADGVDGQLPARQVGTDETLAQIGLGELQQPLVLPPLVQISLVVAAHVGRAPDQGAVGDDLGGSDPQPVITHARAQAQIQRVERMAFLLGLAHAVQRGQIGHDGGAHAQPALLLGDLEPGQVEPRHADVIRRADPGLHDRGDAQLEHLLRARGHHVRHVLGGVGRDVVHHQGPGRLLQEPFGLAALAGRHGAAVGNGDVMALREAGDLEGLRVGHAHVAGVVDQVDGVAVADLIQLFGGGVLAQPVLVVTLADHPAAFRRVCGERIHRGQQLLHGGDGAGAQVDLHAGLADMGQVAVGAMEARHDGGASQVVDLAEGGGRQVIIEADDPTLVDADGVSGGTLGILGVEDTVREEDVEDGGDLGAHVRLRSWSGEAERGVESRKGSEARLPHRCSLPYLAQTTGWPVR